MTAERISELRELRAAADGGEWKPGRMDTESYDGDGTRQHKNIYAAGRVVACGEGYSCRPNATLIAAVVNNLTELLTAAEEAGRLREALQHAREHVFNWAKPDNKYPKYWLELVSQIDAALEGKA